MLRANVPAVVLAPMEGVTDAAMRAAQGEAGGFTYAVTEFLRVTQHVPPKHVLFGHMPELQADCQTPTGLPVQLQLLGGDAGRMAETAARAVECGATAIDLNFGCPAPTVNRHDGGATLLKYPTRLREIVSSVRKAVPANIPVSAKARLGWDTIDAIEENAAMIAEGGASWLTIHARTRMAGYQPPVFWKPIGRVRERMRLPVVANGDIWTLEDFRRCRDETGCIHYMLGRSGLANPRLPQLIRRELGLPGADVDLEKPLEWATELHRLMKWSDRVVVSRPGKLLARLKQWLRMAANAGTFTGFATASRAKTVDELFAAIGSDSPPQNSS